jgi:hypothetical protein
MEDEHGPHTELSAVGSITQEQFSEIRRLREELIKLGVWADRGAAAMFFSDLTGVTSLFSLSEIAAKKVVAHMKRLRTEGPQI